MKDYTFKPALSEKVLGKRTVHRPIERFWRHVVIEPTSGCWLWTGARYPGGYGVMGRGRTDEGNIRVHRFAYLHYRGDIPVGLEPDHLCRVRHCANPWHLELVTRRENFLRGEHPTAVRFRSGLCKYGHSMADAYRDRGARACRTCIKLKYNSAQRHARYERTGQ
mgnify:CR=1 FL=1